MESEGVVGRQSPLSLCQGRLADGKRVELDLEALAEEALNAVSTAARVRVSASGHR